MNRKLRNTIASAGVLGTVLVGGAGVAMAQSSGTTATTAGTRPATTATAKRPALRQGQPGGGFDAHAATIAKVLGLTTTELQTAMRSQSLAQIATTKGVPVQTVIDAYVAEEKTEHPDMTAADVVTKVTDFVNNVRPTPPAGMQPGPGRAHGAKGTASGGTSPATAGTASAKATVTA